MGFERNQFTEHGVGVASVLLGHADIKLTADTYAGLTAAPVIDINELVTGKKETVKVDFSIEELEAMLSVAKKKLVGANK